MSASKRSYPEQDGLPYDDEEPHASADRRDKPKDWRSAFLEEGSDKDGPRREEAPRVSRRDGERSLSRDRDGGRHARQRDRSRSRERHRADNREYVSPF